jgi:hypothetical protein
MYQKETLSNVDSLSGAFPTHRSNLNPDSLIGLYRELVLLRDQ